MTDIHTMDLDAIRDEIAFRGGWEFNTQRFGYWSNVDPEFYSQEDHPIPATLDYFSVLPDGWMVNITNDHPDNHWAAKAAECTDEFHGESACSSSAPTELLARARLKLLILSATNPSQGA